MGKNSSKLSNPLLQWHSDLCKVTGGLALAHLRRPLDKKEIRAWAKELAKDMKGKVK